MAKKAKVENTENTAPEAANTGMIIVAPFMVERIKIRLVGQSPLIVHRWSAKAREMILAKQAKKTIKKQEIRDPEADYRESLYIDDDGDPCFPSTGIKASAVTACTSAGNVTKVQARQAFHFEKEFFKIAGEHRCREDMVRIGMGTADLRYRAEFPNWEIICDAVYNPAVISPVQLVQLFKLAGFAVGIGEWRPERDGQYGRYTAFEAAS